MWKSYLNLSIIIRTAARVLAKCFPKGQTSSRYINLFDLTFAFFTNLHERYRSFLYLKRQEKFDVSSKDPSSRSNFHKKVEFLFVTSGGERSYNFRVLLNALRTYTGNVRSKYFNKLQLSLYNHLLSLGLILFCRQLVYCADGHSIEGHPPPFRYAPAWKENHSEDIQSITYAKGNSRPEMWDSVTLLFGFPKRFLLIDYRSIWFRCFTIICITEKLEVKISAYASFISEVHKSYRVEKLVLHRLIFLLIKISISVNWFQTQFYSTSCYHNIHIHNCNGIAFWTNNVNPC